MNVQNDLDVLLYCSHCAQRLSISVETGGQIRSQFVNIKMLFNKRIWFCPIVKDYRKIKSALRLTAMNAIDQILIAGF